jgi:hypothetical protein
MIRIYAEMSGGSSLRALVITIRDNQVSNCEKIYEPCIKDWTH